jgi:hypothetical protein
MGEIEIKYNSAEKHFLGYARVELNKDPVICASGSLLVDVKPGHWRIAIGQRERLKQIRILPKCGGWGARGWLDLNQDEAFLGLGLEYAVKKEFGNPGPISVKVGIDAGVAVGIQAKINYSPLRLNAAGFWAEMWARVYLKWRILFAKKTFNLVDLRISGDMWIYFYPDKYLEGKLKGRIKAAVFNFGFEKNFKKDL